FRARGGLATFTGRMAALMLPATIVLVAWVPAERIASSNLDTPAFVLVFAGALYLAEAVERGPRPATVLASSAGFSAAAVTRPLYWLFAVAAAAVAVWLMSRTASPYRVAALVGTIPGVLGIGWLARQSILSGYPLYP